MSAVLPSQAKQIGECVYKVTALPARRGKGILLRLTAAAGKAFKGFKGESPDATAVLGMLADLVGHLSEEDVDAMIDAFAPATEVTLPDGKRPQLAGILDLHFAARYSEMTEWLIFALEVNFGGFFGELLRVKKPANAPGASPASE